MVNIKHALKFTRYNLLKSSTNPRVVVALLLLTVLCGVVTDNYIAFAKRIGIAIQLFEPFIIMFTRNYSLIYVALLALLIFGDVPFLENGTPYYLVRSDRRSWVLGQLIYIGIVSILMMIYSLIVCSAVGAGIGYFENMWSETAEFVSYGAAVDMMDTLSPNILVMGSPWGITMHIFGLVSLYIMTLSSVIFAMNLLKGKYFAMLVAFLLVFSGYVGAMSWIGPRAAWFSLIAHANYALHSFRDIKDLPRLADSYITLSALIVSQCLCAYFVSKRYNFDFTGDAT